MKIEHCEYAKYCGDKTTDSTVEKQVWYCPRSENGKPIKGFCPYDCCERTNREYKPKVAVEPVKLEEVTPLDGVVNRQMDQEEKYLRLFEEAKKLEAEGMLACEAIVTLKTTQYALKRLEQIFNYRFNWLSRNIDWNDYDDKIIALKKQKKSHRIIAEELRISETAVNKRWQEVLRGRCK